jgi:SAM-dependent methyltransferase
MNNYRFFNTKSAVTYYDHLEFILPPEKTIFRILEDKLPDFRMLDLGVGAGRTTELFAYKVNEYFGLDIADEMIQACRRKHKMKNAVFTSGNASELSSFETNYFDLVLFSFNGIDCMNTDERNKCFREMSRVLKKNGILCFSSHNINSFKLRIIASRYLKNNPSPRDFLRSLRRVLLMLIINYRHWIIQSKDFRILNDGTHNFSLNLFYGSPHYQIEELNNHNFGNIRIFDLAEGKELKSDSEINNNKDSWLYYLCSNNKL